ncbi:MAG: alpha/beta hydrolase [Eubacterium sp.]|nr:alpha/beta hydrolase [Eubacterium sp.]
MIKNYYVEAGEGKPLILLHGNGEDSSIFKFQINRFSEHFHIYAPDTRSHGKTPRGEKPFTLEQFAEDLKDFMDDRNIEKANILGFSDGGNIALIFAVKYPERVDKLVLNSANFIPEGLNTRFLIWTKIRCFFASMMKNSSKMQKKYELMSLMLNEPNLTEEDLKSIKSKTLVIAGKKDLIKKSHTEKIAGLISDSKLVFINGNHAAARVNPRDFNREVLDFLID